MQTMGDRQLTPHDSSREDWRERRRRRVLHGFDPAKKRGIEFGPLANPIVRKPDGDILYIDFLDQQALRAKSANDPNVAIEEIVPVDVVLGEQSLKQYLGAAGRTLVSGHPRPPLLFRLPAARQ
jgi:hypothetical protein